MADKNIKKDKKTNVKVNAKSEEPKEEIKPSIKIDSKIISATKVLRCECKHEFQDKTYGYTMRVHTPMKNGSNRCTVCSKTR